MIGVIPALIQDDDDFSESPPLVLIHDGGGTTIKYYFLAELERHVWGIANETLGDEKAWAGGISQMARAYVDLIQTELPPGPVILGGWSVGGLIALEMAKMLSGTTKLLGVVMMDTSCPSPTDGKFDQDAAAIEWGEATTQESKDITLKSLANCANFAQQWRQNTLDAPNVSTKLPPVILLRASQQQGGTQAEKIDRTLGWEEYQPDMFHRILDVPGSHYSLFADENVDGLTEVLSQACSILEDKEGISRFQT